MLGQLSVSAEGVDFLSGEAQGQYAQAEPLYRRSLAIWEKALGPDHPNVARSLNNLAELYRVNGVGVISTLPSIVTSTISASRLAAIDDVISRGRWQDWAELRRAVLSDRALLDKVERVCRPYACDPYAQRHHFWLHDVEEHRAGSDRGYARSIPWRWALSRHGAALV